MSLYSQQRINNRSSAVHLAGYYYLFIFFKYPYQALGNVFPSQPASQTIPSHFCFCTTCLQKPRSTAADEVIVTKKQKQKISALHAM